MVDPSVRVVEWGAYFCSVEDGGNGRPSLGSGSDWLGVQVGVKVGLREQRVSTIWSGSWNFTPSGGGAVLVELVVRGKRRVVWCTVDGGETAGW